MRNVRIRIDRIPNSVHFYILLLSSIWDNLNEDARRQPFSAFTETFTSTENDWRRSFPEPATLSSLQNSMGKITLSKLQRNRIWN